MAGSLLIAALLGGAAVALGAYGSARWRAATAQLRARLDAGRSADARSCHTAADLEGLPPPVQRYFRAVMRDGQPPVVAVELTQSGEMNLAADGAARWKPFTARQWVCTRRAGFVWDARIAVLPGVAVCVHDACIAGEGLLHAALLGAVPVADVAGRDEIARGELLRYLAETAWYPTALLPGQGVRWSAVDDRSANATLGDGGIEVTMLFRFDDEGLVESMRADARGRMVGGTVVMAPWEGRWSDYRWYGGLRVPFAGEVAWMMPQGRLPYWRGRVTSLRHEFAAAPARDG